MAATNEVVSMPIIEATLTNSSTFSTMFARVLMKPCSARSALRRPTSLPRRALTLLMIHQPTAKVSSASSTRLPYSMIKGIHVWDWRTSWSTSAFKSIFIS
ncbi:hypothetical protein D9M73_133840 [compost metagenome]